jgi:DNA-binding transcriptional LysR family regulator
MHGRQIAMTSKDDMATPPWDLIRAFLALGRYGDYEVAAEMEHIDDSTLRRRIRVLEQRFGRALFVRGERGWQVAPDLNELVAAAQQMEEAARSFSQVPQQSAGTVRISMLDAFAQRFAGVFLALREKHPRLTLNITTETHFVNLEQEQVDIAIRLARPLRAVNSLRIRKIGNLRVNAYASRSYLEKHQARAQDPAFAEHALLAMNLQFSHQDHSFTYADLDWSNFGVRGNVAAWSDSFMLLTRICELGYGVAIIPTVIAADHPQLRIVHADRPDVNTELWMVSRLDLRSAWQRDLAEMMQAEMAGWTR